MQNSYLHWATAPPLMKLLWLCGLGLYIVYFMRYATYHDTHKAIFDIYIKDAFCLILDQTKLGILMTKLKLIVIFNMYERYILSDFKPPKNWEF